MIYLDALNNTNTNFKEASVTVLKLKIFQFIKTKFI